MAGRIRTIKPEILEDEKSGSLSSDAWRLWVSMWLLADDHGRLRGAPEWLKAQVFWAPTHNRIKVPELLDELHSARLALRYVVDGQQYIEIRTWKKHQRIDHPANPRIPAPSSEFRDSSECLARPFESLAPDLRSGSPIPTTIPTSTPCTSDFDLNEAYAAYPRKEGKARGMDRARAAIRTRAEFDRLMVSIENYKQSDTVRKGFVMLFSTYMGGRWEDYVNGPVGPAPRQQEITHKNFDAPCAPFAVSGEGEKF